MKKSSIIVVFLLLAIPIGYAQEACTANDDCIQGVCFEDSCVECAQDTDCQDGYLCTNNECEASDDLNDEELDEEIEHMDSQEAAEYRLEQFALSIETHIEKAKDILVQANVSDDVKEELEGYIVELEVLLDKVQEMEPTGAPAEMAADFIALKREAWNITKNFRTTLHDALASDRVKQIHEDVREMQQMRLETLRAKLQERREQMYIRHMSRLLVRTGMSQDDIAEKLESGEMTRDQARDMLREQLSNLSDEEREQLRQKVQENREEVQQALEQSREQARERIRQMMDDVQQQYQDRIQERRQALAEEMEQYRTNLQDRKEQIMQDMEQKRDEIKGRMNDEDDTEGVVE